MPHNEQQLFPFELAGTGVEGLRARHSRTGRAIYLTVLLALLAVAVALPLVEVDVSSRSRGLLRPASKLTPVMSPVGGRVVFSKLEENLAVCAGDTLLIVATDELDEQRRALGDRMSEHREAAADLRTLTARLARSEQLITSLYQRQLADFLQRRSEQERRLAHAKRRMERQHELLESGSVARAEVEEADFEYRIISDQLATLDEQQRRIWTQELRALEREMKDIQYEQNALYLRNRQHTILSPTDGELTSTEGITAGSHLTPGRPLAAVSPTGVLQAETYVSPADIGLLRMGQEVQLQLDAFDHRQWGQASATVTGIATDVSQTEAGAAFRVICTLDRDALRLRNGYVGRLKKGMTLTAHFVLTRRTLFQLLRDQLDDWLDPKIQ